MNRFHARLPSLIGLLGLTLGTQGGAATLTELGAGGIEPYEFASSPGMLADLQSWVDQPQTNFGWMIRGAEDHEQTARRIDSREPPTVANRPALTITYDMATTDVPAPPWSLLLLGGTLAAMIARKARA